MGNELWHLYDSGGAALPSRCERFGNGVHVTLFCPSAILLKEIRIDLLNEDGQVVIGCLLYRCWVAQYQGLPELNMNMQAAAIERITLQCDSWELKNSVAEPRQT